MTVSTEKYLRGTVHWRPESFPNSAATAQSSGPTRAPFGIARWPPGSANTPESISTAIGCHRLVHHGRDSSHGGDSETDRNRGGSLEGILKALNHISVDLAVPKQNEEEGTYIIPGHGRICDRYDVAIYRDMLTIIRDRIQDMARRGMSLDQVQAAKPTFDYDGEFGSMAAPGLRQCL